MKRKGNVKPELPLTKQEVLRQLDELANAHAELFRKNGKLPVIAMFVLRVDRRGTIITLQGSSRAERETVWRQLEDLQNQIDCVIGHISEVWLTVGECGPPSMSPNRKEALFIVGKWGSWYFTWTATIERDQAGNPVLGEWDKQELADLISYPEDDGGIVVVDPPYGK